MSGNSKVADDGVPVIEINPANAQALDVIVHELYHMKLSADCYPALFWQYLKEMDVPENCAAFARLAEQLARSHRAPHFLWNCSHMGYQSRRGDGEALGCGTGRWLTSGHFRSHHDAVGLYYFKVLMETGDAALVKRITEVLTRLGKQDGIAFGQRLNGIVVKADPHTPKAEIDALVECLNALFEGKFEFKRCSCVSCTWCGIA